MTTIELYCSQNGDKWLFCDGASKTAIVRHVPNAASGGAVTDVAVEAFLAAGKAGPTGPQYDALEVLLTRRAASQAECDTATAHTACIVHKPAAEALLLSAARVRTFLQLRHMTNANGFFSPATIALFRYKSSRCD